MDVKSSANVCSLKFKNGPINVSSRFLGASLESKRFLRWQLLFLSKFYKLTFIFYFEVEGEESSLSF